MQPKSGKPLVTSLLSVVLTLAGLVLVVAAGLNWDESSWAERVWFVAFVMTFVIRVPYSARNRKNKIAESRSGNVEQWLLAAMFLAMMLLPMLHLAGRFFAFADYHLPDWAAVIGALLQLPYLWLFWRSHADLGRNWSPGLELREDHTLVTGGVYAHMRHPMYAAIWLGAIAQPLLIQNWIAGFLVIPAFAAMCLIRIPREEAMMQKRFGDAYDTYMAQSGAIIPSFHRHHSRTL